MEQVRTFCRRYRRLLMAAAYLLIFAVGVLYLRVTISIPPEGDDKLTLNKWLFDLHRMPYAQFLLQDLQGRLRYFTLQEPRQSEQLPAVYHRLYRCGGLSGQPRGTALRQR